MRRNRKHLFESLESRHLLAGDLRITEVNYHPHPSMLQFGERDVEADDYEFIELENAGDQPLNLRGYALTNGVEFEFDAMNLDPGQRVVVVQDPKDFAFRYGNDAQLAAGSGGDNQDSGEFKGSLRNAGEKIELVDPRGRTIHEFNFYDQGEWPTRADGFGSTLEVIDVFGDYNDPKNWRASSRFGGSPGQANTLPPQTVVVNELLTHTDLPQVDAIELYNHLTTEVDISGWYLTDNLNNPFRFQVPDDTEIGPEEYLVFDEFQLGFRFDGQQADEAYIIESDDSGRPIRFVDGVRFSATENGVSLGRWDNGDGQLFPMTWLTFADDNPGPLLLDMVISEVNYHPAEVAGVATDDLEFIELVNRSKFPFDLGHWQLTQAVEFSFPEGTIVPANSTVLVVGFDPFSDAQKLRRFFETYGIVDNVAVYGPYSDFGDPNPDQLDDDGETIILQRPEDLLQLGLGYVLVDRVSYQDDGDWPQMADGQGRSLTRKDFDSYGDFASSWNAAVATPGSIGVVGDVDRNGIVDAHDIDQLCLAIALGSADRLFDLNQDGQTNLDDQALLVDQILGTTVGDANLDGRFDSTDLVEIFAAGQYEDAEARNSGWQTGDWNCDQEFNSGDLVVAFQAGSYTAAASHRDAAASLLGLLDDDDQKQPLGDPQVSPDEIHDSETGVDFEIDDIVVPY